MVDRNAEKRDVDLLFRRDGRGESWWARVGGGGKRGWGGEVETGWDGLGVAQERWRWRRSVSRDDMSVSRM